MASSSSRKRQRSADDNGDHASKRCDRIPPLVPYMNDIANSTSPPCVVERLGLEVQALGLYLEPDAIDHARRLGAVECLVRRLQEEFAGCEVLLSGSLATGLYLPTSDIDLTIIWEAGPSMLGYNQFELRLLERVQAILEDQENPPQMELRRSARVPVLVVDDTYGHYSVDVTVGQRNGPQAAVQIRKFLDFMPALRPLVLITKLLLAQEGLNKPYDGGIGSYALICMITTFLQMHTRVRKGDVLEDDPRQWGRLLRDLYRFYGDEFEYSSRGLSLREGGQFIQLGPGRQLHMEDPMASNRSIVAYCRVGTLQQTFRQAYLALQKAVEQQEAYVRTHPLASWRDYLNDVGMGKGSLLHSIVGLDQDVINLSTEAERDYPVEGLRSFLDGSGGRGAWRMPD